MGLPRELRLRRHADFVRIAEEGKGRANGLVVLRFAPNSLSGPRFGFSVSKRIGSSVRRNRVKRLLREAVRSLDIRAPYDLVLIARPPSATATHQELQDAVADVVRRARVSHAPGGAHSARPQTSQEPGT